MRDFFTSYLTVVETDISDGVNVGDDTYGCADEVGLLLVYTYACLELFIFVGFVFYYSPTIVFVYFWSFWSFFTYTYFLPVLLLLFLSLSLN